MRHRCLIATSQTWSSTAALPALVAQADCRISVLSPGPLDLSLDVAERFRCSRDPHVAARELRSLVRRYGFDRVIVADELLLAALCDGVSQNAPESWLPIDPGDAGAVALALSKFAFFERARDLGLDVPRGAFANSPAEAVAHARRLGFPVVLKGDRGFAGSQVRVCANEAAVIDAARELPGDGGRVLVQEYLAGEAVSACVVYDCGTPVAYKAYRAQCAYPDTFAASTVHAAFEHPTIEGVARALGAATRFHGLAGIDFMLADGRLRPLEINPRPTMGFTGTRDNRAFFAPVVRRLLRGEAAPGGPVAYGGAPIAAYFPGHLFYVAARFAAGEAPAWTRVAACLREARARDALLIAWEVARYIGDRLGRSSRSGAGSARRPRPARTLRTATAHQRTGDARHR